MDREFTTPLPLDLRSERARVSRLLQGRRDLSSDRVGTRIHELIAQLLTSEVNLDDSERVLSFLFKQERHGTITHRQARRARLISGAANYVFAFRRHEPWAFLGAEVNVGDVRLDLLWINPEGQIEADEIKSGNGAGLQLDRFRTQAESQFAAGREVFGDRFTGVRLVILAGKRKLFYVRELSNDFNPEVPDVID